MPNKIYKLTIKDFALLVGTNVNEIPVNCKEIFETFDFRYQKYTQTEIDRIIKQIQGKIDLHKFSKAGKQNKKKWQDGWSESLKNFIEKNYDLNELVPKYIRPGQPIRLFGTYIAPLDLQFELHWYTVFRIWLFQRYFNNVQQIYEFGCGSGHNIPLLAQLFPDKVIHCLDWVPACREIVRLLSLYYGWNLRGYIFDMFLPNYNLPIKSNSAVLTMGGLEQLNGDFEPFLNYLLKESLAICLHMEPLEELYDPENPFDYIALKFHRERGYLSKFLTTLKLLDSQHKIKIIKIQKVQLGSLYHDGYSFVVWK